MYELKVFRFLEEQYQALIKQGLIQLECNWAENPIKMKGDDKKVYTILVKRYISTTEADELYEPEIKTGVQKMILDFFVICREYWVDLAKYYETHFFAEHRDATLLNIPDEVRHEAAQACRMDRYEFICRLSSKLPLKKHYKLLKLEGRI